MAKSHDEQLEVMYAVGTVVSGTVTNVDDGGWPWLDVDGLTGSVTLDELALADRESVRDRYTVGETIDNLFVWRVNHEARILGLSAKRNAPGYVEALRRRAVGDVVSATVTRVMPEGLWVDVDGLAGSVSLDELALGDGESAQERYAVGQPINDLFVWQVDHEDRSLELSVKRNAPGYVEALQRCAVGEAVSATVTRVMPEGLWLDVDGLAGHVTLDELTLAGRESVLDRYVVGEIIEVLVWQIDDAARAVALSVRSLAAGSVKKPVARGATIEVVVREVPPRGVLMPIQVLTENGDAWIPPHEWSLSTGPTRELPPVRGGQVIRAVVLDLDDEGRPTELSRRRALDGWNAEMQRLSHNTVVPNALVIPLAALSDAELRTGAAAVDLGPITGFIPTEELDREAARALMTFGAATTYPVVVESVDYQRGIATVSHARFTEHQQKVAERIELGPSAEVKGRLGDLDTERGVAPLDPVEALAAITLEDTLEGIVTEANEWGCQLDVAGVVGWIPARELPLDAGQSPRAQYNDGDTISAHVWMVDQLSRTVILSVRRLASDFAKEPVVRGTTIDAVVRGSTRRDVRLPIRVLAANNDVRIPPHEWSLSTGTLPQFRDGQVIHAVVLDLDDEGRPTRLSPRRVLDGWDAEMKRLSHNIVVPNARLVPPSPDTLSDIELRAGAAAVDLGPITGFVPEEELDRETGRNIATYNETYRVVVESVDRERGMAVVSHERFGERWRELAAGFEVSGEVKGELRDFDGETALLDLGSGLLAQMPARELPDSDPPSKAVFDRVGERFSLRITAIDRDSQAIYVEHRDQWVESLIGEPESETLEFKEVLKGDPDADDAKEMTRQAMRTINAFLNTEGGRLIIGVHDVTREVTGLEGDPGLDSETIEKKIDQAIQMLEANLANLEPRDLLNDDLDGLVTWDTPSVRGGTLLVITCKRGPDSGVNYVVKGKPEFWVREGSSKKQLRTPREIRDHLRTRQQRAAAADDAATDD